MLIYVQNIYKWWKFIWIFNITHPIFCFINIQKLCTRKQDVHCLKSSLLSIKGSATCMLYRAVVYHFSLKKMCIHRKAKDEILEFNRKTLIDLIGTKISPRILKCWELAKLYWRWWTKLKDALAGLQLRIWSSECIFFLSKKAIKRKYLNRQVNDSDLVCRFEPGLKNRAKAVLESSVRHLYRSDCHFLSE